MKYSVRWYVSTSHVPVFPHTEPVTWPCHVIYPLSHGSTSASAPCAASCSSSVPNRSISISLLIRSIIPIPSFLSLSLKISCISKFLIQGIMSSSLIWWPLSLMPFIRSSAFKCYAYLVLTILLLSEVMLSCSHCSKVGLVCVVIASPFGRQPLSCVHESEYMFLVRCLFRFWLWVYISFMSLKSFAFLFNLL